MTRRIKIEALWAGAEHEHRPLLRKERMELLLRKIKQAKDESKKENLRKELKKIEMEVELQVRKAQNYLY